MLTEWCDTWQMEINVGKTKHLEFSSALIPSHNTYTINDTRIVFLHSTLGEMYQAKKLRTGEILVELNTEQQYRTHLAPVGSRPTGA